MTETSQLLIVTGPPGAGKSTISNLLVERFTPSALVEGDAFFAFLRQGVIAPWKAESHHQNVAVIKAAAAAAGRMVAGGITVVYDGVVGPWFLPEFVAASGLSRVHYAVLLPTEAECLDRVSARTDHEFKDLEAARHMYQDYAGASINERYVFTAYESPVVAVAAILHELTLGHLASEHRNSGDT
jgi:2-phosphoglycerate kinase